MRFLLYLIICVAVLGIVDIVFFHNRYRYELWSDMQIEARKIEYDVRRAVGL